MKVRIFITFIYFLSMGMADLVEDKQALLDFVSNIPHGHSLNWREEISVCEKWRGVICDQNGSHVVELHLPGIGLNGRIPPNTISRLNSLLILSLRANGITGPFPVDFFNLAALTGLHLQFNSFSGPLPFNFSAWKNLRDLDLSYNDFNGSIPSSISNLTLLSSLNLSNNSLVGIIPEIEFPRLHLLNLSNNHLNGSVPKSLQKFPKSSFLGNELNPVYLPSTKSNLSKGGISQSALLGIVLGGSSLLFVAFAILLVLCYSWRNNRSNVSGKESKGNDFVDKAGALSQDENNQLIFFKGCNFAFDLEDLLRASAEVLGKGTNGAAYKAVLDDTTIVVVKRIKEISVGKKDFVMQMEMVGRIQHENVVELKAYYYSKDEKLIVYDYYGQGSVSSMLHGITCCCLILCFSNGLV